MSGNSPEKLHERRTPIGFEYPAPVESYLSMHELPDELKGEVEVLPSDPTPDGQVDVFDGGDVMSVETEPADYTEEEAIRLDEAAVEAFIDRVQPFIKLNREYVVPFLARAFSDLYPEAEFDAHVAMRTPADELLRRIDMQRLNELRDTERPVH